MNNQSSSSSSTEGSTEGKENKEGENKNWLMF
jgi:hypothetical protein